MDLILLYFGRHSLSEVPPYAVFKAAYLVKVSTARTQLGRTWVCQGFPAETALLEVFLPPQAHGKGRGHLVC